MAKLKVASFFSGAGGIDVGFELTKKFEIIYANEFDEYPAKIYDLNHKVKTDIRDIHLVEPNEVPNCDVIIGGFPCTSFSIAGYRKGFEDERSGDLFFELARIIKAKKPKIIFLENVKNLVGHDNGKTFSIIQDCLEDMGYHIKFQVLNAMHYGNIPQNRERIYIVGFLDKEQYKNFEMPGPVRLTKSVKDVIDFENKVDDKYYYTEGKYKGNLYEQLVEAMQDDDINNPSVYQWRRKYVRKNQSGVVPTLTANQGEGGHNVCLIKTKFGIRKMTPRECFNTQGYPKDYKLPNVMSDARLYKAAGNSVVVSVIKRIADNIIKSL